ncbi:MAG: peptide chain release factor-like protein, partial [Planctomycetales bacterium]|nr:peptide chain release factor-like protein [Planctomycetales bacterium]
MLTIGLSLLWFSFVLSCEIRPVGNSLSASVNHGQRITSHRVDMSNAAKRHPSAVPLEELERDCKIERLRRSGPGGQHRNKVETAVVITHQPTG